MTDDADHLHHAAIERGRRAQAELDLVSEALAGLRQAALEEIVITSPDQLVKRERLIVCAQIIDALKASLLKTVQSGTDALNYRNALAEQNLLRP